MQVARFFGGWFLVDSVTQPPQGAASFLHACH